MLYTDQCCRLSKYQKKCDNLVVEHKEMRNKKDREIEDLWNEWGTSQAKAAAVELEYVLYAYSMRAARNIILLSFM